MGVLIRKVEQSDLKDLWACEVALVNAGEGMVVTPAGLGSFSEFSAKLVGRCVEGLWWGAEIEGFLRAEARVQRLSPDRCAHVGILAVGVHPAVQGRGIGRALCERVIEDAWSQGLTRIELYVRADNARAIRLYESLGFAHEGRRERFIRLDDGTYVDDLILVKFSTG